MWALEKQALKLCSEYRRLRIGFSYECLCTVMNQRLPKSMEFLDCLRFNLPRKVRYFEVILMSLVDQFIVKQGVKIVGIGVL
jgi:hypothetical protein